MVIKTGMDSRRYRSIVVVIVHWQDREVIAIAQYTVLNVVFIHAPGHRFESFSFCLVVVLGKIVQQ